MAPRCGPLLKVRLRQVMYRRLSAQLIQARREGCFLDLIDMV
ncbi:hypothetical protein OHA84_37140 [Streptomyces sp. NBC_00513]|nr:hypothetical protein [Streptomyces sp. NBC_00424]MCX5078604.1 hypothetical protein [Streptomyces sp. NBC_00424]WUD39050.1 hypothetical protein OHA84_00160 [Streptomyces sp. NBC_00513]WUD45679.1 hypothetical protein OHA84_37140 [Streptomyces sp. NBC_00513]